MTIIEKQYPNLSQLEFTIYYFSQTLYIYNYSYEIYKFVNHVAFIERANNKSILIHNVQPQYSKSTN